MKPVFFIAPIFLSLAACAASQEPIEPVETVDIEKFMGDWYVIAHIPTFLEDKAYNAIESYSLDSEGNIPTVFTFREGGFDGEEKRYEPKGFVKEGTNNAIWGMQFVWPIKADYRIMYLDEDYQLTVIGRNKRDFVWIMARTPEIDDDQYDQMIELIRDAGYAMDDMRKVPQQWPGQ